MENEQILRKAISKAIKNGYNPISDMGAIDNFEIYRKDCHWKALWTRMIFDHDFAKAFWGESPIGCVSYNSEQYRTLREYEYHLQQMVLEKEPLKYLEKFLDSEVLNV